MPDLKLTKKEEDFARRLFANPSLIGSEFKNWLNKQIERDPPSLFVSDLLPGNLLTNTITVKQIRLPEVSEPSSPPANQALVFVRDNGSGKTQLVAKFPSGLTQVIVTEPGGRCGEPEWLRSCEPE